MQASTQNHSVNANLQTVTPLQWQILKHICHNLLHLGSCLASSGPLVFTLLLEKATSEALHSRSCTKSNKRDCRILLMETMFFVILTANCRFSRHASTFIWIASTVLPCCQHRKYFPIKSLEPHNNIMVALQHFNVSVLEREEKTSRSRMCLFISLDVRKPGMRSWSSWEQYVGRKATVPCVAMFSWGALSNWEARGRWQFLLFSDTESDNCGITNKFVMQPVNEQVFLCRKMRIASSCRKEQDVMHYG